MSTRAPSGLSPLGTARERLLAARGRADAGGARFPDDLREAAASHDLGEEGLFFAWEVASFARGLAPPEQRALVVLTLASLASVREGSTRLCVRGPGGEARLGEVASSLGAASSMDAMAALLSRAALGQEGDPITTVIGRPGERKPLILDGDHLYQQRMLHYEDRLVEALAARLAAASLATPPAALAAAVSAVAAGSSAGFALSVEQRAAVEAALVRPLTIVTGGPGTGKTSIVVSILRALVRLGVPARSIALAAPTGKAAHRMDEAIGRALSAVVSPSPEDEALRVACPEPATLHRLLGWSPSAGRFKHHENNPLAATVVVVDECSMIDLFLMDRLLRGVRRDARLVLLGDADQLPSIDAGAVLRDLSPGAAPPARGTVALTRGFRMQEDDPDGRRIAAVAARIKDGDAETLFPSRVEVRESLDALSFHGVELLAIGTQPGALAALLERFAGERLESLPGFDALALRTFACDGGTFDEDELPRLGALFDHLERSRILCVTRGRAQRTGAEAVNLAMHQLAESRRRSAGERGGALLAGEPVMALSNDYERALFNGDQGLILRVAERGRDGRLSAVFRRKSGFAAFPVDSLGGRIELSYAMTVHKAQGSELDRALVLLPERDVPLLTREVLYTAVTRCRRSVVVAGSRELFARAISRRIPRDSGVADKLAKALSTR